MPTNRAMRSRNAFRPTQIRLFENRPLRPWASSKPLPDIEDLDTFYELHEHADDKVKDYLEFPRSNYYRMKGNAWCELAFEEAMCLYANNTTSRINFANIAAKHVRNHSGLQSGPVVSVTITPKDFAFPLATARDFHIHRLQQLARQALHGFDFVGMVEVALYKEFGPHGPSPVDHISWHAHLLVWGTSKAAVTKALKGVRKKYFSMTWNSSAYCRKVDSEDIERSLLYMLKSPQKEYRAVASKSGYIDQVTGEIFPTRYKQKKRWLRTGDRVRLCEVLADQLLDKLFFGCGAGVPLVHAINREALTQFRGWLQTHPAGHS